MISLQYGENEIGRAVANSVRTVLKDATPSKNELVLRIHPRPGIFLDWINIHRIRWSCIR